MVFLRSNTAIQIAEAVIDNAENNGTIYVASITIVELTYLIEKGGLPRTVLTLLPEALDDPKAVFRLVELTRAISDEVEHISRPIVPDMPDRIISATALYLNLPLVTKDEKIQKLTTIQTIW